jgi:chromosome segregation ATPase
MPIDGQAVPEETMNAIIKPTVTVHALARLFLALAIAVMLWGPVWANAENKASREREALRRAQMQLQQIHGQVSTLAQEKAVLGKELEQSRKQAKTAQGKLRKAERGFADEKARGEQLAKEMEALKQDLASTRSRLTDTEGKLAETTKTLSQTQQNLARTEADKRGLEGVKLRQEKEISACEGKNLKLYQTGRELMTRFEQKTCGEILAQKEPFTGLKRVEVENLLEEYRDKLDEQKLIKPPGS